MYYNTVSLLNFFLILFQFEKVAMGRHKKGDPNVDVRSVKQGLSKIIRPQYTIILIEIISRLAIEATKIANLASLLLLMMVRMDFILVLCFFL